MSQKDHFRAVIAESKEDSLKAKCVLFDSSHSLSYYRARQLEDALESLQVAVHLEPDSQQIRHDIESLLKQKRFT